MYDDRIGNLIARATKEDLDGIERILDMIRPPQQVTIEVRYCEVEIKDGKAPDFEKLIGLRLTNSTPQAIVGIDTNGAATTLFGILTAAQYRSAMTNLSKQSGMDLLATPRVTTLSGRQAQIKVVDVKHVVTGLVPSTNPPSAKAAGGDRVADTSPITEPFEVGPTVDLVPTVLADGETIRLTVIPSVREFLGYDGAANALDEPRPRFRVRQNLIRTTVGDGQTLVLAGGECYEEVITRAGKERQVPKDQPAKALLIFVTPTLIDPAGNPVHPEAQPVRGAR
jgi:general secretion pathway protein D